MKQLIKKLSKVKLSKAPGAKGSKTDTSEGASLLETSQPEAKKPNGTGVNVSNIKIPFVKNSKGTRVAFTLLLVRPWVLLVGFWLFSLLGGAIAIEGLISPKRLTEALPETPQITPVAKSSLIDVEQRSDGIVAEDSAVDADAEGGEVTTLVAGETAQSETSRRGSFPTRTLIALVGTCAAGCLVISRRRAMMRMAAARARNRSRRARAGATSSAKAKSALAHKQPAVRPVVRRAAKPAGVAKLAAKGPAGISVLNQPSRSKKRRQRNKPGVTQPAAIKTSKRTGGNRPLTSRSTAQKNSTARSVRPKPVNRTSSRVNNRQSVVSVVPASESHVLDWTNGSLAHDMDVRHQQKAM